MFDEGGTTKNHMEPSRDCMDRNPDILLFYEGHSDPGFVSFAEFWDFFFSGTVDDVTFLATSNNHMADVVNTVSTMVIGQNWKFLQMQVLTMWIVY